MAGLLGDLAFTMRGLRRAPGAVFVSVVSLGLGIGLSAAIFSAVRAVVFQALPFPHPERLYLVFTRDAKGAEGGYSHEGFTHLAGHVDAFEGLAAFQARVFDVEQRGSVQGAAVTGDFFRVLDRAPALGRGFTAGDGAGACSVVLSHEYWRTAFAADRSRVGSVIRLDGRPCNVAGVMPQGFSFPRHTRLWTVLEHGGGPRDPVLNVVGRLQAGATVSKARLQVQQVTAELGATKDAPAGAMSSVEDATVGRRKPAMLFIELAVVLVFLIACLDVGALLLARHAAREGELALRLSLGAGGWQVWRLLLCEGVCLGVVGGLTGILLAQRFVPLLVGWTVGNADLLEAARSAGPIVAWGAALSIVASALVTLPAGLRAISVAPALTLGRHSARVSRRRRVNELLVALQVCVAVALLVPAAAVIRSLLKIEDARPGFEPQGAVFARLSLAEGRYQPDDVALTLTQVLEGVRNVEGVAAAGLVHILPFTGWNPGASLFLEDAAAGDPPPVDIQRVSAGYFEAMRIPVLQGRPFSDSDSRSSAFGVAVVNDAFRRRFIAEQAVLGRRLRLRTGGDETQWLTIVGLVGDVRQFGPQFEPRAEVYVPSWAASMALVVRAKPGAGDLVARLQATIPALDPKFVAPDVRPLEALAADVLFVQRTLATLVSLFGTLALALSAVGVYSVSGHAVQARLREIGVRLVLGATAPSIVRLVLVDLLTPLLWSTALGLLLGAAATRALRGMLYQVRPCEPQVLLPVLVALTLAVSAAVFWPLRRALRVDPAQVLHVE